MKSIFRNSVILSLLFISTSLESAKNTTLPSKTATIATLNCKNSSSTATINLTLMKGLLPIATPTKINKRATVNNINIPASITSVKLEVNGIRYGAINIQKSMLKKSSDGKYNIEVKTTLYSNTLDVNVYNLGVKIGHGIFIIKGISL